MKRRQSAALVGVFLGILLLGTGISAAGRWLEERPGFCLSCHEMHPFGRTFRTSGAADHHSRCIFCHSGAGVAGVVTSQMTGLHELWKHFFGHPHPSTTYMRGVVPNENCIKCHTHGYNREAHKNFQASRLECSACHNHFENQDFSGQIPVSMKQYERRSTIGGKQ